jgi:hypothetical protein
MKKIIIPIYQRVLFVHIGVPSERTSKKHNLSINPTDIACVHETDDGIFVWFSSTEFKASIATHESVHIKNLVFDQIAAKPDFENDEHEAYFVEWIVETIEKVYKKHTSSKQ